VLAALPVEHEVGNDTVRVAIMDPLVAGGPGTGA
jgi:hypothetical protein